MVGANPRRQFIAQLFGVLAGSLLVFAVLAGVMLLTRHVKWGGFNEGA